MNGTVASSPLDPNRDAKLHVRPGQVAVGCMAGTCALSVLAFWVPWAIWLIAPILIAVVVLAFADYRLLLADAENIQITLALPPTSGRARRFDATLRVHEYARRNSRFETRVEIPLEARTINSPNASSSKFSFEPESWNERQPNLTEDGPLDFVRSFTIGDRGKYLFGPVWLRRAGKFGMVEGHRRYGVQVSIDVLPETYWASQQLAIDDASEQQLLDRIAKTSQQGTGTEFESLSEFRHGDDPQRIDWRASARNQHLIIRRYQIERHRDVMIVVDCGRLMASETKHGSKLDCAVDSALMLGRVALRAGDRCGLATYDDRVHRFIPPMTGGHAMSTLVHNVYDLRTDYRESDFGMMFETLQARHRKRSLLIVLSDIADEATTKRYRSSLIALSKRHVVLFAAIRTPLLSELPRRPVETILAASRQTVAFRLQQERERAVNALRRSAVHVLDVEPSELTVPLINQFVDLRTQNLL